ncbi:MAG: RodZ domain-containing protein [Acidobacteriota bacterium]
MASLGQQLKQAREERGVSIKQIADATRLGSRFLQAIENDDYKILPGGIFNRNFVRKFAHEVGMDEEQAVRLYDQQLVEMGGEPTRTAYLGLSDEAEAKASSGNTMLIALLTVVVLGAVLGAVYLAFFNSSKEPTKSIADATPVVNATPAATPTATPTPEASPTPEEISGLRIQLIANQAECWVSFRADGGRNEQASLKLGESRELLAKEKITFIRVGNLPALNILINGKRANTEKLAPGLKGLVANNVVITKDNYKGFIE